MSGCATFALIFGGVMLLCIVAALLGKSPKQKKADDAENARLAAAAASAKAAYEEQQHEEWSKQCRLKPAQPVFVLSDDDIRTRCHILIDENMKVPGSGDFPSERDDPGGNGFKSDDGCHRIYNSYVDAKNAFGVKVRTQYACTFDPRSGDFTAKTM